jgi:Rhodanese-like domain
LGQAAAETQAVSRRCTPDQWGKSGSNRWCGGWQTISRQHQSKHEAILKEINVEHTISTEELKAKLDQKDRIKVVETLAPERYREAHIPGALNIPPERIKEIAPQLLPDKTAEIVTYCASTH